MVSASAASCESLVRKRGIPKNDGRLRGLDNERPATVSPRSVSIIQKSRFAPVVSCKVLPYPSLAHCLSCELSLLLTDPQIHKMVETLSISNTDEDTELPSYDGQSADETEVSDTDDAFPVLKSQLIDQESKPKENVGSTRTSFTADSPYFDAFCESEIHSLNLLSSTLGDISTRAKIFAQTGAMMSEATRQLAVACKLRHGFEVEDDDDVPDDALVDRRKEAIGKEMAGILELLGEVR